MTTLPDFDRALARHRKLNLISVVLTMVTYLAVVAAVWVWLS